ncbi:MAG TPA: ATP-dependent DNA helicase RecG, partial [Candidatus Paceibacterota bacterium]|nr:ATP-dependent DNA helicase RecG [Candidatus Paceibacterota bacterium]
YIANPEAEIVPAEEITESVGLFSSTNAKLETKDSLFAVYPETSGITSLWFRHALEKLFKKGAEKRIDDPLSSEIRDRYHLPHIATALLYIHAPDTRAHAEVARKRFSFEEIFVIQTSRALERLRNDAQAAFPITAADTYVHEFLSSVPFPPTKAQNNAIHDILADFQKPHPMARLLEGDVGSGKTFVAAAASVAVVHSRPPGRYAGTLQVAYMAPTEILAQQHFNSFIEYFSHSPIQIGLITGSGCKKFPSKISKESATTISRALLLKWVQNGEIALLIGTHALIQKSVRFQNLALTIIDEQHRFGTAQRRALSRKSTVMPHFLSMTATPIPRTLALTLYGDLDISLLDELPPGRAKITTKIVGPKERETAYEAVRRELEKGHQAYVICPRIEEPDPNKIHALQAKSAKAEAKRLQKDVFPEFTVGLLHGAMTPREKEAALDDFSRNKIQVLVATSVVEVGINVPNATAIIIEGAERFGLAQLHQLRGRIMRSSFPPICFLVPGSMGTASYARLRVLEKSDDGFKLAEADLANRGAGDLLGARQSGISDLGMEALKNLRLIQAARKEAESLIATDATLESNAALKERVACASTELHNE